MARADGARPDTGGIAPVLVPLAGALLALLALAAALAWQLNLFSSQRDWRLAGGEAGGTYQLLAQMLAEHLEEVNGTQHISLLATDGSAMNLRLLQEGRADLALAQGDAQMPHDARLLASVYAEWLHVLIAGPPEEAPTGLVALGAARTLWMGSPGSGVRGTAERVLAHFGVSIDGTTLSTAPLDELPALFGRGELDGAVLLAPPGARVVRSILELPQVHLVPVPGAPLSLLDAAYRPVSVPPLMYGTRPDASLDTVAVDAMLVARRDVEPDAVRTILEELMDARPKLSDAVGFRLPLASYAPERAPLPYHRGAAAYFLREKPSWFVRYAEAMSLVLTLMVGAWSVTSLLVRWNASRRKERIDVFYARVRDCSKLPRAQRLAMLERIEQEAMQQLINERLSADQAFLIFQNYLRNMILEAKLDDAP